MIEILTIKRVFGLDDVATKGIQSINTNIITKFTLIEGCRDFFNPDNGFHCSRAQKTQQPAINLLALASCAKAITDDLTEITRILFQKEFGYQFSPWFLKNEKLKKKYPNMPLTILLEKYGLYHSKQPTTPFQKVKKLRDTLIHRQIEKTYFSHAAQFFVYGDYTHTGNDMTGYEYSHETFKLIEHIVKEINNCLVQHGKNCLIE